MILWSHHITSRVMVPPCALQKWIWIWRLYGSKKNTDNPKKRTADAQANTFGCVAFERLLGQLYMCVEILLYSVILFTSNFTDHVLTAKYLYDKISGIFKWGNPLSGERERGEKGILIFHLGGSPFNNRKTDKQLGSHSKTL